MERFTKGELEVMRLLWEHGELTATDLQEKFPRSIKNSALRSYLTILLAKGHVARQRKGKPFYYRAKTKKEPVFRSMFSEVVDTFFNGSREALLCRLIKAEALSDEELLKLKKLAEKDDE
jgi:BlaI family penicillinase repressor